MVDKQYKNNLASINDVLDALNDLEKAKFKLEESYFNQRRASTYLLHAKGLLTSLYNMNINKMKTYKTIFISGIALLTLNSCGNDKEITSYRGRLNLKPFLL